MPKLLSLPNRNLISPDMIGAVKQLPKGVVLNDASNQIIDFIPETDPGRRETIFMLLEDVVTSGRSWKQPNWKEALAKSAVKPDIKAT